MTMSIPPLTDAEKQALIDAAIKDEKKRKKEQVRRFGSGLAERADPDPWGFE
jgi:hypothetical protein